MDPRLARPLAVAGLLALAAGGVRLAPALSGRGAGTAAGEEHDASADEAASSSDRRAVLVELFTSQGCSSCPPADRLLTRLGQGAAVGGVRVVPLAFHVDYWNYIGWTDPFSSAAWSGRQQRYGRRFALGSVYTPQLVVQGESQTVGSNEREVRGLIATAAERQPAAEVALESRRFGDRELVLQVTAKLGEARGRGAVEAWVALFENGLSTAVGRGENAHRTLRNDHVVRRLERAFALGEAAGASGANELLLAVEDSWSRDRLGAVAFVQETETLAVLDVAVLEPGKLSPASPATGR